MPTETQALLWRLPRAQRSGGVRILWSTAGRASERFPAALRKQKRISENYDFFDSAHGAVHYPKDRRFRIWVRPNILLGITVISCLGNPRRVD